MNNTCNKTSNNKYFDCPARMDDGRAFTDYRPSNTVDDMIRYSNNVMNSYDYRQFLIHNANNIMEINISNKQKEIIDYNDEEDILVIACPGSGKTHTIICKYIKLINNNIYKPNEIILITFTKKAGNELCNRLNKMIPNNEPLYVGTIHGFAYKILKKYNKINSTILDEIDYKNYILNIDELNNYDKMFEKIGCEKEHDLFSKISMSDKDNLNIQPLILCKYRDEFNAKLEYFLKMFRNFGLSEADSQRATAVIGELGNNVFDHNLGNWPTPIVGAIIAGQNYPAYKKIEITIGDPGVGFYESLTKAFPDIKSDTDAIKKGLEGNTGRVGEQRGNGLKLIQEWTINNFSGQVMIHSGDGLAIVAKDGIQLRKVHKILGTIAQFVIHYN